MTLVRIMIEKGLLKEGDLPRITEVLSANPHKPLHEILIDKQFAREQDVYAALGEEFGMDVVLPKVLASQSWID